MTAAEIAERLDRLVDHGFVPGWRRVGRRWVIDFETYELGPYTQAQAAAFVEGCNAMGAAP